MTRMTSTDDSLPRALKLLHDVVNGKLDLLASSQSDRATLRELGYVATNHNGNSYITKAGKNAVKAVDAGYGRRAKGGQSRSHATVTKGAARHQGLAEYEEGATGDESAVNILSKGYLKDASKGRVTVDDDQYNTVVVDKRTREPLFAIAYGEGQ